MPHAEVDAQSHVVRSTLNYFLDPAKGGYKDFWFGTVGEKRRPFEYVEVPITDIRCSEDDFHLDKQGFQHVREPATEKEFVNLETIKKVYYPECAELVRRVTGATRVHVMGHVCRRQSWDEFRERTKEMQDMDRTPIPTTARYIHVDYSYDGAKTRLEFYLPQEAEKLSKTRWAIINIWRPIGNTVTRENLTMCDARSVDDSELRPVIARFRRPGDEESLNPVTRAAYNRNDVETWSVAPPSREDQHKWYYCSKLEPEEALLIKIYDSKKTGVARRTLHTAFVCDEDYGPPRESVEVRTLVFWEDQNNE
ncbi:Hydroxylase/desaturase asaB [Pseudocercospora fuligena]|uniref:Hydroxylase/desaturase asaB n=1 Tax=Pseudocercospora fuligena TaxID=685502 RepID=A0A8H6VEB8_9PEZI|nr:Hydroxylase/desaturase asaB [Pseudocercospora fuligena]